MLIKPEKSLQKPVFFNHDGSVDDFVSLITLLTLDQYRLTGIAINNGNCYIDKALESTLRILNLFCRKDIPVALSDASAVNEFPQNWREKNEFINQIEILSNQQVSHEQVSSIEAAEFTARCLLDEKEKTTVVLTGPASNLAKTFQLFPESKDKVERILWMAGAFLADGNVKAPDHDGSAEWNIFWDPVAASDLLETGIPVVLFPLDVCRQLPVDNYVMYHLNASDSKISQLVHELFNPIYANHSQYYMWDVIPVVYLSKPELFVMESTAISVEMRGTSMGNVYRSSKGNRIKYTRNVDDEGFYDYLIEQLQQF